MGFGHLVRCRSLARALSVAARVSVRGSASTRAWASAAGWQVAAIGGDQAFRETRPQIVIVDDPSRQSAHCWVRRARRHGVQVVAIHDLGLGYVESDLGIDGSIEPRAGMRGRCGDLRGVAYAILDPSIVAARARHAAAAPNQILITLGGGTHVRALAADLCRSIAARAPAAQIRVATGFAGGDRRPPLARGQWITAPGGLAAELAAASIAVVAGGVTLYEACALGVPTVAVALTPAQHTTIRAFAARGAAVDGGLLANPARTAEGVATEVERLLRSGPTRRRLALAGRRLVDGRGAFRVADAVRQLCAGTPQGCGDAA